MQTGPSFLGSIIRLAIFSFAAGLCLCGHAERELASLEKALAANLDLWGEAAMQQTNGPSYEFFERLLPPPRYVNADFHFYPIVLSTPNAKVKAQLISTCITVNR